MYLSYRNRIVPAIVPYGEEAEIEELPVSQYLQNRTGEDNGDAHLKRQVMGREVVVAVTGGKLDFG